MRLSKWTLCPTSDAHFADNANFRLEAHSSLGANSQQPTSTSQTKTLSKLRAIFEWAGLVYKDQTDLLKVLLLLFIFHRAGSATQYRPRSYIKHFFSSSGCDREDVGQRGLVKETHFVEEASGKGCLITPTNSLDTVFKALCAGTSRPAGMVIICRHEGLCSRIDILELPYVFYLPKLSTIAINGSDTSSWSNLRYSQELDDHLNTWWH